MVYEQSAEEDKVKTAIVFLSAVTNSTSKKLPFIWQ